ncbi:MAG: VaFE repeat-containing surface-anchored protein [Actinomycetaceae bacterium]|nr:VaFE repeat-containing surface-anchored protein [Actinomycetaceae bacterium]
MASPAKGSASPMKKLLTCISVAIVGLLSGVLVAPTAMADTPGADPDGLGRIGYKFRGSLPAGEWNFWAGSQYRLPSGVLQFCVNEEWNPPRADSDSFVSAGTLTAPSVKVPGYEVTTSQMAWLLNKYNVSNDPDTLAALSVLVHANFEQPDRDGYPSALSGVTSAQEMAHYYVTSAEQALPGVTALAKKLATEAINSGVKGYTTNTVAGEGKRSGSVTGFGIKNGSGAYISGLRVTATLSGPAVWDETNTATIGFTSTNGPIVKTWHATGHGDVSYRWAYVDESGQLDRLERTSTQDTIRWSAAPRTVDVPGRNWRVVFDFKPAGVSNVGDARVIERGGILCDTFVANADPDYGDGEWMQVNGKPVSVVYRADLYRVPTLTPAARETSVPAEAVKVASVTATATAPGQRLVVKAPVAQPAGFYAWVWRVDMADQLDESRPYIKAGFADDYGAAHEQSSIRWKGQIDSALSVRQTQAGQYLVDDVWVSGFPSDHPLFRGNAEFKADVETITHKVLFFPFPLAVTEAHRSQAIELGDTVKIPAKNGFYPSVGDPSWLLKVDEQGRAMPGTYVFVSEFAGDDRAAPLSTSVEDKTEQFVVPASPSVHTTLMYEQNREPVPNFGSRTLTDVVTYTNLTPGQSYVLTGTLMNKETGKPVTDVQKKPIVSSTSFIPKQPNGTAEVSFTVDAEALAGKTLVAFERLLHDGREVAIHADIDDERQTIRVRSALHTTATDQLDGDHVLLATADAVVEDKVCDPDRALVPGVTYQITGSLIDKSSAQPLLDKAGKPVAASMDFTPKSSDECASVVISFDASDLAGRSVVVFEDIAVDGNVIARHHDLDDAQQTVRFEKPQAQLAQTGTALGSMMGLSGAFFGAGTVAAIARKRRQC